MDISFKNEWLLNCGNHFYKFDWPIGHIEVFEVVNSIIVLLNRDCYRKDCKNVFCVDFDGNLRWQIPDVRLVLPPSGISPYTLIRKEGETVKAFNWDGTILTLNPETGEILDKDWTK